MTQSRVPFNIIVKNQLPQFVETEFPLIGDFLEIYYRSQEFQGASIDLIQNIDQYVKLDNNSNTTESTLLLGDIEQWDTTINVSNTLGFPDEYGLIKIDDEIITYKSKTDISFIGCTRGFSGISDDKNGDLIFTETLGNSHSANSTVENLNTLFLKEFLNKTKYQLLPGLENRTLYADLNKNLFIKQSKDFYSSRGTNQSFKILFRALYGVDVDVIKPSENLISPSEPLYKITNDMVVEPISGDVQSIEGYTLLQHSYEGLIDKAYSPITSVEKILVGGASTDYYKLRSDASFSSNSSSFGGAEYGSFTPHPKTKCIGKYGAGDATIDVDSTVGFPNSGELYINYSDRSAGIVSYTSSSYNQFYGCTGIEQNILDNTTVGINTFATVTLADDKVVKMRISSVLSDIKYDQPNYSYEKDDTIEIKTLGITTADASSNSWIFNAATSYEILTISLINIAASRYRVTFENDHIFRIGDTFTLTSSTGDELFGKVYSINTSKNITIGDQGTFDESLKYTIKKDILKVNSTNFPTANVISANVTSAYKDGNDTLVAASSIPYYKDQQLNVKKNLIKFEGTFSGDTFQVLPTGDHGFYTGDIVYYTPQTVTQTVEDADGFETEETISLTGISDEGIYFVKRLSDTTSLKLARSRSELYNEDYITTEPITITDNTIEFYKFRGQELENHKLLRKIQDPSDVGGLIETEPGVASGILVNGVEILNYKSADSIYYGRIENISVDGGGSGYNVITPPDFNISDPAGVGATANVAIRGTFEEIRVIDGGFDYIEKPTIKISGGNGIGAKAEVNLKLVDHEVDFNSDESFGLVDLTNNIIAFSTYHKFRDYEHVIYKTNNQDVIVGLTTEAEYFVDVQDTTSVKLYKTKDEAVVGINTISLTGYGSGRHAFTSVSKKSVVSSINIVNGGSGYENKKTTVVGLSTALDQITVENHGYNSGELINYSTEGTVIGGLTSGTDYYITKLDKDTFKLSQVGSISGRERYYYDIKQYISLTSTIIAGDIHYFNYQPISVKLNGRIGISSIGSETFEASIQPIVIGEIVSVNLVAKGSGYGSDEILNFNKEPEISIDNGNSLQITPVVKDGKILEVIVENGGSNIKAPPSISIDGGSGLTLTPVIENGQVTKVNVINGGIGFVQGETDTTITYPGSKAVFRIELQKWGVNLTQKNYRFITDDDGFIDDGLNTDYGLQYVHLYSPRKLREILYASDQSGNSLFDSPDLIKINGQEEESKQHSPIIGWAYDGNPIYGPYGYSKIDGGVITQMLSGYKLNISVDRPSISIFEEGFFVEDYVHIPSSSAAVLDENNGRFCVTPEFPKGTYAYFATISDALADSSGVFVNYKRPVFPYLIGDKFHSKPSDFNFIKSSNQDDYDIQASKWLRNTTMYNLLEKEESYKYFPLPYKMKDDQLSDVSFATPGKITSVGIVTGGTNYKVNDSILFDNTGTSGFGADIKVSKVGGKDVTSISCATTSINDLEVVSTNKSGEYAFYSSSPHNYLNIELVSISGISTSATQLSGDYNIGVTTSVHVLTTGVGTTGATGIVTYFSVYGNLDIDNIRENNVLTVGIGTTAEKVKVLNIDKISSRLRVLREVEGTGSYGIAHTATEILYEDPRRFTCNVGLKTSFNFRLNKEIYFNPPDTLGLGTLVGIGTTITFSNPGAGITQKYIPTQSLYLPKHELKTNDELIYNLNGGSAIGVSTNGSAELALSDQQRLYVAKIDNDLIGISTVRVGLASTGTFAGIGNTTTSLGLLYFTNVGSGDKQSFKTNYDNVVGTSVYKNTVTVATATTHNVFISDNVYVDVKPSVSIASTVSYNDYNRRIVIDKRTIAAGDINITTNEITVSDHGFVLGQKLIYTADTPAGGLTNEKFYYVVIVNKDTIKLSESYYDSISSVPTIVDITSAQNSYFSPVNPPIKLYRNASIVFDLSDSSLVYVKNAIEYPAFTFEFFEDEGQERIFNKVKYSSEFEVIKSGVIGIDGQVTLVSNSELPRELYYNLVPIQTDQLTEEKLQISIDNEVNGNNTIEIIDSIYNGKQTVSIGGTNTFTYYLSKVPESLSYTQSNSTIVYSTDSSTGIGSITEVKIFNGGNNYYKMPLFAGVAKKTTENDTTSGIGSNAVLTFESDSVGLIKKTKMRDVGFDYPYDKTLRPTAKLPEIISIEDLAIFDRIGITSAGRGYGPIPPKVLVFDGRTDELKEEVDLLFESGASELKIMKNTYGVNNLTPRLLPTRNSNGVGISTIGYSTITRDATITLSTGFSTANSFPFSIGDEVMIENVAVGRTALDPGTGYVIVVGDGKGYNTDQYNYKLFTITGKDENLGGVGFVTVSLDDHLSIGETPGSFYGPASSGRIIAKKDFPVFDIKLTTTNFLKGEGIISLDDPSIIGKVGSWDSQTGYLKVQTNKDFVPGHVIEGTSTKTRGTVSSTKNFTATYDLDAKSTVESGWEDKKGFLNLSSQVIQDGDYYQRFSYALQSSVDLSEWDDVVSTLNHTAGFKKFSNMQIETEPSNNLIVGSATTQSYHEAIVDFVGNGDLNCVYNYDLASENSKIGKLQGSELTSISDEVVFNSKILTDYSESIGNRVLSIDDVSSQFNSNPRATRYSNVATFANADANAHKYITYVQDRRYTNERQMMIMTLLHDDGGLGYMNQYARVDTQYNLGSFDYALAGSDGIIQFHPTKYAVNGYNVFTLSYNLNDIVVGTGSSDFGGVKVSTASTTVAAGVGTGTKTNFVSIATTYTSARVLFEFKTSSGDYEFNELTLVHDGTTVDMNEYGRLTNLNESPEAASGLGTYHPYISGGNVKVDFTPNVEDAATINAVIVSMGSTAGIGSFGLDHAHLGSEYYNIPASGSPTENSVGEYSSRYDGAYIIAQVTDKTNNKTQISELMLCDTGDDGDDVYMTEWGNLVVGNAAGLGTFGATYTASTDITALKFTPTAGINVEVRTFYNYMRYQSDVGAGAVPSKIDFTNAYIDTQFGSYSGTESDIKRAFNLTHETYNIFERYIDNSDNGIVGTDGENVILDNLVLHLDGRNIGITTTWEDISSESNNSTIYGSPDVIYDVSGRELAYKSLPPAYGTVPDDGTDFDFGTGDFTIEAWVRPTSFASGGGANQHIIAAGWGISVPDNTFSLYIDSGYVSQGTIIFKAVNGALDTDGDFPSEAELNVWQHIVVSRIGSTVSSYLDGVKGATETTYSGTILTTQSRVLIGKCESGGSGTTDIAVVRVYKGKGLDASEVDRNYKTQRGRFFSEYAGSDVTDADAITIPNHFFVSGEELTYSTPGTGTTEHIGIVTTSVPSIGSTDKLPSTVFAVKIDSNKIKLAATAADALAVVPTVFDITSVGIGNTATFTAKNQNQKVLIALDNYIQSPVVGTAVTTTLSDDCLKTDDIMQLVGITSIASDDLLQINDSEIVKVQTIGIGTLTNAILVKRPWLGTVAVGYDTGASVKKVSGNYNIVNNVLNFTEAPYGNIPEASVDGDPYDRDWTGISTSSVFQGRSFIRSGTQGSSNESYSKNYLFDDISHNFNGTENTFTLTQGYANVSEIEDENGVLLINDIFQIPGLTNDYTTDYNASSGITSAIFTGTPPTLTYDVNKSNLPIGGVIVSVGSSEGLGYQPLIGAGATITIAPGASDPTNGTISAVTIGYTGSGYRAHDSYEILTDTTVVSAASTGVITLNNKNSVFGILQMLGYGSTCTIGIGTFIKSTTITSIGTTSVTIGVSSASVYEMAAGTAVKIKILDPKVGIANIGIVTGTDPSNKNVITHIGFSTIGINTLGSSTGMISTGCSITNTDAGFSTTKTYDVVVDEPRSYSNVPLVYQEYGVSTVAGLGTYAVVDITVSEDSAVSEFSLSNTGYGYILDEYITVPTGGVTGIPTHASALGSFEHFSLSIDKTYTDKFSGWSIGQLQPLDSIYDQFDGIRKDFQLRINGVITSIKASKGSGINIQDTLLVFYNNILQVPGEGYIFPGGSTIIFGEPPEPGDTAAIIFYKGSGAIDVKDVDILETIKEGDSLQINNDPSLGQGEVLQEDKRLIYTIDSTDLVSTNPYFGPGNITDINFLRPVNWYKQTEDFILNGKRVSKDRALYEANIYPNTNVIQSVGVGSTAIYVDSIRPLFDQQNENNISVSFQKDILLVSQDPKIAAAATATVSAGGSITSLTLSDGGVGYSTNPVVIIENPVGLGSDNRATARAYISSAGIVTGLTMTGPGTGYTSFHTAGTSPQVLMTEPPGLTERISSGVVYTGDCGLLVGIGTTSIVGTTTALVFELLIPDNSFMQDTAMVGTAITVSEIDEGDYFVLRESNLGMAASSIDGDGGTVGIASTALDNVYKALKAETILMDITNVGGRAVREITVGVTTYGGSPLPGSGIGFTNTTFTDVLAGFGTGDFDNFVYRNYYGSYTWGRIDCNARTSTQEFPFYNQNGVTGIDTSAYVRRYVPLKYVDYDV